VIFLLAAPAHQPELPAAFLLLAACVLVVPAAGWCLWQYWRALVLVVFSGLRASIWGSHIETPYKKE
jgi:hypothetical protein